MIDAISAVSLSAVHAEAAAAPARGTTASAVGFSRLLEGGLENLQTRLERVDAVVIEVVNGQIESPHSLMVELEQARISLQMAVEVRNRLIEGYQELLRMQV